MQTAGKNDKSKVFLNYLHLYSDCLLKSILLITQLLILSYFLISDYCFQ